LEFVLIGFPLEPKEILIPVCYLIKSTVTMKNAVREIYTLNQQSDASMVAKLSAFALQKNRINCSLSPSGHISAIFST
jgi:hypothetical protein